jgi:tetratricopeptide (TPR) repeat protein
MPLFDSRSAQLPRIQSSIGNGDGAVTVAEALIRLRSEDADARREAALALGRSGSVLAVAPLVGALKDPHRAVRAAAEEALWSLWTRSGNAETDAHLREGTRRMEAGDPAGAIACFSRVIARAPDFAEGYNKRATALYLMGDFLRSLDDVEETLKRNPEHFGALSGGGLCMLKLKRPAEALGYFERALAINPNMESIRSTAEQLRKQKPKPLI